MIKSGKKYVCATRCNQKVVTCKKKGKFWRKVAILLDPGANMAIARERNLDYGKNYLFDHKTLL
jgi:hypothetical protein